MAASRFFALTLAALSAPIAMMPAQQPASAVRSVRGIVYDSLAAGPLPGALVSIVSSVDPAANVHTATAEADGHFEFPAIAPGTYLIGFEHPLLDSIGIAAPTHRVVVPTDGRITPVRADVAVPSAQSIHDAVCTSQAARTDSSGVLIGHLLDAETRAAARDGRVVAAWMNLAFANGRLTRTIPSISVTPASGGWFAFCGLPPMSTIGIQATTSAGDSSGIVLLTVPAHSITRRDFFVGKATAVLQPVADSSESATLPDSARALPEVVHRGTGRLSGVARAAATGRALPGVSLSVEGTGVSATTGDDGTFSLSGLPLGTQTLLARKVGFAPDERPVDILAGGSPAVNPRLSTMQSVLDTVRVVASRIYAADRNGFRSRQKTGMGHYFDAEQIAKIKPFRVTDLLRRVPGVTLTDSGFDVVVRMRGLFRGACTPTIYLDGAPLRGFSGGDLDGLASPDQVAGVEIYRSAAETPAQYMDAFTNCGTILVWTRTAPAAPPAPKP